MRKYFTYAFGEILLVVIGILIALSINNLNTKRQQQRELKGYLEKIADNMAQDMALAAEYKVRRDSSNLLCIKAVASLEQSNPDYLLLLQASASVFVEFYFIANKSGFEALKASGYIGKLKNNKIDSLLNEYYFVMAKLEREEKSYNTFIENMEVQWLGGNSMGAFLPTIMRMTADPNPSLEGLRSFVEQNKAIIQTEAVEAVIFRGASEIAPQSFYRQLMEIGTAFIEEVEKME